MRKKFIISLVLLIFLLGNAPHAGAFFLEDWINAVKEVIIPPPKIVSIDSSVERMLSGDENKNGIIDGGDIVTFKYTIKNPTEKEISFATLKTNINRKQLNFIHNIKGTSSLNDDGSTIEIPNFRIGSNQVAQISFDARLNYISDVDSIIATESEFVGNDHKLIAKSDKKEIIARRIKKEKIPGMLKLDAK